MYVSGNDRSDRTQPEERAHERAEEGKRRERASALAANLRSDSLLERLLRPHQDIRLRPTVVPPKAAKLLPSPNPAGPASSAAPKGPSPAEAAERQRRSEAEAEAEASSQAKGTDTHHADRPRIERDHARESAPPSESHRAEFTPRCEAAAEAPEPPGSPGCPGGGSQRVIRARGLSAEVIDAIVGRSQLDRTGAGELRLRVDFDLGTHLGEGRGHAPFSMEVIAKGERSVALVFRGRGVPLRHDEIDQVVERLAARGVRVVESVVETR